jgi:hypothetical protein
MQKHDPVPHPSQCYGIDYRTGHLQPRQLLLIAAGLGCLSDSLCEALDPCMQQVSLQ